MKREAGTALLVVIAVVAMLVASWGVARGTAGPSQPPADPVIPTVRTHELVVVDDAGQPRVVITANQTAVICLQDPRHPEHRVVIAQDENRGLISCSNLKRTVYIDPDSIEVVSIVPR